MNKNKRIYFLSSLAVSLFGFLALVFPSFAQIPPQIRPTTLPEDIPLYPGATIIPSDAGYPNPSEVQLDVGLFKSYVGFLENKINSETVISWYRGNLPEKGWTVISDEEFLSQIWPEISKELHERLNIPQITPDDFRNLPEPFQAEIKQLEYGKEFLSFWKAKEDGCRALTVSTFPGETQPIILSELHTNKPCPNMCTLPPETEQERQEIINRVEKTYGLRIGDSDLCGNDETCGDNSPLTVDEVLEIERVLGKLPYCFTKNLRLAEISGRSEGSVPVLSEIYKITCCKVEEGKPLEQNGYGLYIYLDPKITLCDKNYLDGKYTLEHILVHELTHSFQYTNVPPPCEIWPCTGAAYAKPEVIDWLKKTGWSPDGICIPFLGCTGATIEVPPDLPTEYAKKTKNPLEDMAESVALYVTNPKQLLEISPRRYNFVKDKIVCNTEYYE